VNVIGVLPGKSLPEEAIIFSAHFDHVRPSGNRIFNGANDNASGTTALLMLASYYRQLNNNERTLIFCAFSGEELGLLGSGVFVNFIHPPAIKAVVNLEMLGRTNVVSKKEFFLTGNNESNLFKIFEKNLVATPYKIAPDKKKEKNLFMRSDNYPFYLKGIPAHTIMCSDDDDDCYHQPCDDLELIDISNMVDVIKGIITACTTLVNGVDTPVLKGSRKRKK
jgi:Zn-dependent M28 family amino/carboxypeptidase